MSHDEAGHVETDEREVWVRVKACTDHLCDRLLGSPHCARVVIEDDRGNELTSAHTGRTGAAHWPEIGLHEGEYVAKVYRAGGDVAEMMTEEET